MSDDYFFGDEDFDNSTIIAGLDAFEAAHNLQKSQKASNPTPAPAPVAPRPVSRPPPRPEPVSAPSALRPKPPPAEVIDISDDEYKFDDSFDLENANWDEFDQRVEVEIQQPQKTAAPVSGPSNARQFSRTSSGKLQQQTLWGLPAPPDSRHKLPPRQKGKSIRKTKTWDRTEYAKSGWRVLKKNKSKDEDEDGGGSEGEGEPVVFQQFPQPTNLGKFVCFISVTGCLTDSPLAVGYDSHCSRSKHI
jgi:hypothetical protein